MSAQSHGFRQIILPALSKCGFTDKDVMIFSDDQTTGSQIATRKRGQRRRDHLGGIDDGSTGRLDPDKLVL